MYLHHWKEYGRACSIISLGIFKSDVLSVLFSKSVCQKQDVFQNKCLRGILGIYWPKKISNYELSRKTCVRPVSLKVKQRRWRWIGMYNALDSHPAGGYAFVSRWKTKAKNTQGGMETISWTGDEGERVKLRRGGKTSDGQAKMAFTGNGLSADTHEED